MGKQPFGSDLKCPLQEGISCLVLESSQKLVTDEATGPRVESTVILLNDVASNCLLNIYVFFQLGFFCCDEDRDKKAV